jgi:biotin operon repressor
MEVIAGVIELAPDSEEQIKNWSGYINTHIEQALQTLRDEGVEVESFFHLHLDGKDYLLTYQRVADSKKSHEVFSVSESEVDRVHREFKKSWLKGHKAKLLVDLAMR